MATPKPPAAAAGQTANTAKRGGTPMPQAFTYQGFGSRVQFAHASHAPRFDDDDDEPLSSSEDD